MAGWFGSAQHVKHFLDVMGADKDASGNHILAGDVFVGIGGQELVVDEDAVYFVKGERRSLASGLNGTSYGTRNITVISGRGVEEV